MQKQNLLQHRHKRNHQTRNIAMHADDAAIQRAPHEEVERGDDRSASGRNGGHRHRQLDITLRQRRDEVRDVTTGARCNENHTQRNHRRKPVLESDAEEECECRKKYHLADYAEND